MTGHDRAVILDAAVAFDYGEQQISEDGDHGIQQTDDRQDPVVDGDVAVDQLEHQSEQQRRESTADHTGDRALNGFLRADDGI